MSEPVPKEVYLCKALAEIMNLPEVRADEDLIALGIKSFAAMQFFEVFNDEMNTNIPTIALFEYPTINSLLAYVAERDRE